MRPTATVLLPVYNAEKYLTESLESLLSQTYADFEILVIDDASTDRSREILLDFSKRDRRIRILIQPENRGLVEALNLGLRSCESRYVFRHDADDRAHRERIAKSLDFFGRNPATVLLGSWIDRIDPMGKAIGQQRFPETDSEIRWQFLFRNPFAHSTVAFDREKAIEAGGYSNTALHAEDYDLWTRLAEKGGLANLPESLCEYRTHDGSISVRNRGLMESESAHIGARWLAHLLGSSPAIVNWEKLRKRESLSPKELRTLIDELIHLSGSHPELAGYPTTHALADLAWHLASYLKNRPVIAMNPLNYSLFARVLPALRDWPSSRWRTK